MNLPLLTNKTVAYHPGYHSLPPQLNECTPLIAFKWLSSSGAVAFNQVVNADIERGKEEKKRSAVFLSCHHYYDTP